MTVEQTSSTDGLPGAAEPNATAIAQLFHRDARDIPPMTFDVPDNFLAYPMRGDPAERLVAAEAVARELYGNGTEELWQALAPSIAAAGEMNAVAGAVYAALGVYDNEQDGIATCTLTVGLTASDHTDPEVAALGLREILVRDEFNDSRWLDLPCGPAVSRLTVTAYPLDPELTGGVEDAELAQGQIQVYIPFPTGPWIAVLTMQTANMEVWPEFSRMMAGIAASVDFPAGETAEIEIGDGAGAGVGTAAGASISES